MNKLLHDTKHTKHLYLLNRRVLDTLDEGMDIFFNPLLLFPVRGRVVSWTKGPLSKKAWKLSLSQYNVSISCSLLTEVVFVTVMSLPSSYHSGVFSSPLCPGLLESHDCSLPLGFGTDTENTKPVEHHSFKTLVRAATI